MKSKFLLSFVLACLFAFSAVAEGQATQEKKKEPTVEKVDAKEANQTAQKVKVKNEDKSEEELHYWLYLPSNYDADATEPSKVKTEETATQNKQGEWPLLIFLHGMGERGPEDGKKLDVVRKWGPPKMVADRPDFPFVTISPQCPDKVKRWNVDHVNQLIDQVVEEHKIDRSRIYLTGLSMGGYGTWALAAEHPEKFAAAIPVCGGGDVDAAKDLLKLPIWAFHGEADKVVPFSYSKKMVDAIKAAGGKKAELTGYEGVGHNSWSETYANQEIYDWLLEHQIELPKKK